MDVGIVVATYGSDIWKEKAKTAVLSAQNQTVQSEVIHHHAQNLARARNEGASMISSEYIIFLDADDSLDENYVKEMIVQIDDSDLRQPSTLGVYPDNTEDDCPVLIPARSLLESNYLVIGTMCRRDQFLDAGGFDETFPVLEDWDLWVRMWKNGAIIGARPKAIYRVGVHPNSRNQNASLHGEYYTKIRRKYV